jgi:hypothetical protein
MFKYFILFFLLCVTSQAIEYQKIFIPEGVPFSLPQQFKYFVKVVDGSSYFTNETKYDCGNSHQYDWNKLTGISFTPWRPDTDALMVAWRYLIKNDVFEIAPYYNVKTARILPLKNESLTVDTNKPFKFYVDYYGISVSNGTASIFKPKPNDLNTTEWLSFRISTWFGGSSLPPNNIFLYLYLA